MPSSPTPEPEDIVVQDAAAMGRGLRVSAILLVLLLGLGALGYYVLTVPKKAGLLRVTRISAPAQVTNTTRAMVPRVPFTDITAAAGIRFRHNNGATGEKLLPETMGGGVAFFDFDNDGDPDLLFVNSAPWPWKQSSTESSRVPGIVLYQNDTEPGGPIHFTPVSGIPDLERSFYGMGVAAGDYDGDGWVDVLITGIGGARLLHNEGGISFHDATTAAAIGGEPRDWSTAAAWFDFDNDGDLDLYVGNYVRWSREIDAEVGYKLTGGARAYGPPMNFQGAFPHLYRNDGEGHFTDISAAAGVQVKNSNTGVPAAKTLGVVPIDLNGDGWIDLVVANDTVQNFVFENQRNGTFREAGAVSGMAFDSYGNTRGAMGIDAVRFTHDGQIAVAIGNFANEMTAFYVAQNDPMLFNDEAISWGIGGPSRDALKFGVFFLDYDLDGRLDLMTVNGHLEEEIGKIQHGQRYEQSAQLYWNAGATGMLTVGTNEAGSDLFRPIVGRGGAFADLDGDGDLDCVFTSLNGSPVLLRNDLTPGPHWLRIKLQGTSSNREAIGAWVHVVAGRESQWRHVMPTRSYLSQSELELTFGLGTNTVVDLVEVTWPGDTQPDLIPGGLVLNRLHRLSQKPRARKP